MTGQFIFEEGDRIHMDVGYSNTKGNFSLRAAALIIHDNDLLLAQNDQYDCYYTVGGGIQQNETSENAVIRECYEEMGCHFEIDRLVFVQERLYKVEGIDHHEIVFFYLMKKTSIFRAAVLEMEMSGIYNTAIFARCKMDMKK